MLSKKFHAGRRKALSGMMKTNTAELYYAGDPKRENGDQEYPFVPDADFYYLTGFEEKSAVLAAVKDESEASFTLFIKKTDRKMARWTGESYTASSVKKATGIKEVKYLDELKPFLEKLSSEHPEIKVRRKHTDLAILRQVKEKEEIECHKTAAEITIKGVNNILTHLRPGMHEYEIEAYFDFVLKSHNAGHAFETIAASGANACVLHYTKKDALIKRGDMVLFDLGASWNGYACDVSRTYPASGKFTRLQKKLYEVVLEGLKAAENAAKPGVCKNDLQFISKDVMAKKLVELGIIGEEKEIDRYYHHGSGHYIGLFTHDVGDNMALLEKDMMFTLEPGLYFDEYGIGIRIEDTLLVTRDGVNILTDSIPKEPEDIERIMKTAVR